MTVVYTKKIDAMQAYKDIDGETDVVFSIMWSLVGEENGFTTSCPATTNVPYIAGQTFTPFSELTKAEVESWIDQYTTLAQMQQYQNSVAFSLLQQQQQVVPNLPWNPAPVSPT
jgi:hypothetical protein